MKVFLGGTSTGVDYRPVVIDYLEHIGVDYFNPIVDDWKPEDVENENFEKNNLCDVHLYVITNSMKGVYSIAEIMDSVYRKVRTIVYFDLDGFDEHQIKSFKAIEELICNVDLNIRCMFLEDLFELPSALTQM